MRRKLWVIWKLIFAKSWYFCCFKDGEGWQWHDGMRVIDAQSMIMKLNTDIHDQADQESALEEFNSIINKT